MSIVSGKLTLTYLRNRFRIVKKTEKKYMEKAVTRYILVTNLIPSDTACHGLFFIPKKATTWMIAKPSTIIIHLMRAILEVC